MMATRLMASICAALLLPQIAHAATDTQAWETLGVNVALGDGWRASNELVVRTGDARGLYEVEENAMIGYRLPHRAVTLWLGYTHDPQYLHGHYAVMENRFRQQVSFDNLGKVGPIQISGRLRLEERWRPGIGATGWRLRPFVRLASPICGHTLLVVSNESFVPLNHVPFQAITGLDRMRTFVGLATPLTRQFTLEAGYLNQHAFIRNGPDNDDHVLSLGINATL